MNKFTTLVLMGLVAIAGIVRAGGPVYNSIGEADARVAGFGNASLFIGDISDIWTLPAVVAANPNAMYLEFGKSSVDANTNPTTVNQLPTTPWGGAHLALGPGVLGVWLSRPVSELSSAYAAAGNPFEDSWSNGTDLDAVDSILGISGNPFNFNWWGDFDVQSFLNYGAPKDRVDLFYAWSLNDKTTLGVGLNRAVAGGAFKTSGYEIDYDANNYGVNLGADIKDLGAISLLQVGAQYNMESILVDHKEGGEDKFGSSGNAFNIRVGADISDYRAEAKFGMQGLEVKDSPDGGSETVEKVSVLNWGLGLAMTKHSAKMMGLAGLILGGSGNSVEVFGGTSKAGNLNLSYVAAGEGKIREWLTARAGISGSVFGNDSTDDGAGTTTSNNTPVGAKLSTGLGLAFGNLVVDGSLNQNLLYTGGFLTSGIVNSLFSQVSATWAFGGGKE